MKEIIKLLLKSINYIETLTSPIDDLEVNKSQANTISSSEIKKLIESLNRAVKELLTNPLNISFQNESELVINSLKSLRDLNEITNDIKSSHSKKQELSTTTEQLSNAKTFSITPDMK
jgi:hypothetical protein